MSGLQDDLDEYDNLTIDVANSTNDTFTTNLQRWFDLIGETPLFTKVDRQLEQGVNFKEWLERTSAGDEYGATRLTWPPGLDGRLGMQLALFRAFMKEAPSFIHFHMMFMTSSGTDRFDDMLREVRQQVFDPMARDLRRRFLKMAEADATGDIPASDRVVTIDHNGPEIVEANEALDNVAEAIRSANDYEDDADRGQRLAEISASKMLLSSLRVRAEAIIAVIYRALRYLTEKFVDKAIGAAAAVAFAILGRLTHLW